MKKIVFYNAYLNITHIWAMGTPKEMKPPRPSRKGTVTCRAFRLTASCSR